MAQSRYFRYVTPQRYRDTGADVQRGIGAGAEVGKLLGGLAGAIKSAQKDALANKLMTQQSISDLPGAGTTVSLGKMPGGPQPAQTQSDSTFDPNADLSTDLPEDVSPALSTPAPANTIFTPAADWSAPGATISGTAPDPVLAQNVAAAKLQSSSAPGSDDFSFPSDYSGTPGARGTVGGLLHTGGMEELGLQQEAQKMQAAKVLAARQAAEDAYIQATRPLELATKRANLAAAQAKLNEPVDLEKNPPPLTNVDSEPAINQNQLTKHIDGSYGSGSTAEITSSLMEPETIDDPQKPGTRIPNPAGVAISGDTATLGSKNKRMTMPLTQAQVYTKQLNAQRLKQGLPLLRVPGEDQSVGATADNPYIAKTKLDALSRAHGTYVKLPPTPQFPNGQIRQIQ